MPRHLANRPIFLFLAAILWACSPDDPPSAPRLASSSILRSALADAPQVLADAVAGKNVRGEQDEMLRREAELPGFGGFFIDDHDQVVVYMKRSARTPEPLVRKRLADAYASRTEARIREVMPRAANAKILDGDYTLSELIAVENRLSHSPILIPGYVGVGTSLLKNRVVLEFSDSANVAAGLSAAQSIGIPLEVIVPEVWGEVRVTTRWADVVRPLEGGIKLSVLNRTAQPNFGEAGSVGYNVITNNGTVYFLTAGHIPNVLRGSNGVVGDTVFQPGWAPNFPPAVGTIVSNPAWGAQCGGINPRTGRQYDFCIDADVALGSYINGNSGERKIGTSMYEGQNGAPSINDQINGFYPISGVATPEFINTGTLGVHKSGYQTGTTTGQLVLPDAQAVAHSCWGTPTCNLNDPNQGVWFALWNVTKVDHAGWGYGDSGGPVFAGDGAPYYALGIQSAGTGPNDGRICTGGTACAFLFARWSLIEQTLGMGTLNPATNPPPPFTVTVSGTSRMTAGNSCTFTASASGGTAPYSFTWSWMAVNGASAGGYSSSNSTFVLIAQNNSGQVYLTANATDALGATSSGTWQITFGSGSCAG